MEQAVSGGVATVEGVSPSRHSLSVDTQGVVGFMCSFPGDDGMLRSPVLFR